MSSARSYSLSFFILAAALVILFCVDVMTGSVPVSIADIFRGIIGRGDATVSAILWQFRFPKAVTCMLAGAGLATSGLLMQTLFRNPLAGPDVLGLSSGASLAVGLLLLAGRSFNFIGNVWTLAMAASAGGAAVLLVMLVVARRIKDSASILIIGLMLAAATSSFLSVMQFASKAEDLQVYVIWTMGSVGNAAWSEIAVVFIVVLVGVLLAVFQLKALNTWLLGENYARSLGVDVRRSRLWIVVATGLLTGAITAFCGPIAFVGLAVPHLARLVTPTADHKVLLPGVIFGGAILLLFCDVISQVSGSAHVLPLNAITSLIGAPVVIWQVMKFKKVSV